MACLDEIVALVFAKKIDLKDIGIICVYAENVEEVRRRRALDRRYNVLGRMGEAVTVDGSQGREWSLVFFIWCSSLWEPPGTLAITTPRR